MVVAAMVVAGYCASTLDVILWMLQVCRRLWSTPTSLQWQSRYAQDVVKSLGKLETACNRAYQPYA